MNSESRIGLVCWHMMNKILVKIPTGILGKFWIHLPIWQNSDRKIKKYQNKMRWRLFLTAISTPYMSLFFVTFQFFRSKFCQKSRWQWNSWRILIEFNFMVSTIGILQIRRIPSEFLEQTLKKKERRKNRQIKECYIGKTRHSWVDCFT